MGPKTENKEDLLEGIILEIQDLAEDIKGTRDIGTALKSKPNTQKIFKARISCMDSAWDKFSSLVSKGKQLASSLEDKDNFEKLTQLLKETRNYYYEAISINMQSEVPGATSRESGSAAEVGKAHCSSWKLPTINLQTFTGNIATWNSFKDTYISLIHNNQDLTAIQKFHYLKGSLKGLALQTIASIPVTEDTYPQAWSTLLTKYDNKRILAATYLTTIFNSKPMLKGNFTTLEKFSNVILESALAFKNIHLEDPSGFILMTWMLRLLDPNTREKFETKHADKPEGPTFDNFVEFLHKHCTILQAGNLTASTNLPRSESNSKGTALVSTTLDKNEICPLCKREHRLFKCPVFEKLSPKQRYEKVKTFRCCTNCLSPHHRSSECTSIHVCRHCDLKHHSALHFSSKKAKPSESKASPNKQLKSEVNTQAGSSSKRESEFTTKTETDTSDVSVLASVSSDNPPVLLGTAMARIKDAEGNFQIIRLMLDSGSQRSIITSKCANRLGLRYKRNKNTLYGLSNSPIKGGKYQVACTLATCKTEQPQFFTNAVVVQEITPPLPSTELPQHIVRYFSDFDLADKTYWKSGKIDFLLGADLFGEILSSGYSPVRKAGLNAIGTVFGLVIMGRQDHSDSAIGLTGPKDFSLALSTSSPSLEQVLEKFWNIEEENSLSCPNPQETQAEEHFINNHYRTPEGRYVVRLPFKNPENVTLGNSYHSALNRFRKLEARLNSKPSLKVEYSKLLQGYLEKGYMSSAITKGIYFLPHHCVSKASDPAKLRIVLDASMPTASGSLNDQLLVGPKLHLDIKDVILNFRRYRIALTADISEMFLRILLHPSDRKYQHILYRFDSTQAVQEYELNTLTFGQTSSPFLALRVIRQLVDDEGGSFPKAGRALIKETYVDDILTGANSVQEAIELQKQLIELLSRGGFSLKKWASNSTEVLRFVPQELRESPISFIEKDFEAIKILGMIWDPVSDYFTYKIQLPTINFTKRSVLSLIARLYDPLGYLAPVIFKAKTFLQKLWSLKLGWDDDLPGSLKKRWSEFHHNLEALSAISIPRCLFSFVPCHTSIVGFADASSLGYAAALYLRLVDDCGNVRSNLIFAKTKLAPLKTISIPRLELCAAVLLVKILKSCQNFISTINNNAVILCSDSTVVLSWLAMSPHTLKVFVANRVTKVLQDTSVNDWYHVPSASNPADLASRGVPPSELLNQSLWWQGPSWFQEDLDNWPISQHVRGAEVPELRPQMVLIGRDTTSPLIEWLSAFTSYTKLTRTYAFTRRFLHNTRHRHSRIKGPLSISEVNEATERLIKATQKHYFMEDLNALNKGEMVSNQLAALSPFIDSRGVLRVGGRLTNSMLPYEAKHPILLPTKAHLSKLIVDHLHKSYLHAGALNSDVSQV